MDTLETSYSLEHHIEGEARHLDAPLLRFELSLEVEELKRSETWRTEGRVAKTLAKDPNLQVVRPGSVRLVLDRRLGSNGQGWSGKPADVSTLRPNASAATIRARGTALIAAPVRCLD